MGITRATDTGTEGWQLEKQLQPVSKLRQMKLFVKIINVLDGHVVTCAYGAKRTSEKRDRMSVFGGKADIALTSRKCPLMTQSGQYGRSVYAYAHSRRHSR
jgi:hypothetical protein